MGVVLACMSVYHMGPVPLEAEEASCLLRVHYLAGRELPCGCKGMDSGVAGQSVLLPTEPHV